jgi:DNA-3-methyladenine glycosylase
VAPRPAWNSRRMFGESLPSRFFCSLCQHWVVPAPSPIWVFLRTPEMMLMSPTAERFQRTFFSCSTRSLARKLLGCRLVRQLNGTRLCGIIVETEAYIGENDLACHARAGRTRRTEVMYGPAGVSYVYFTYGMHWMLNVVAEAEGFPAAVLIRAIEPLEGVPHMQQLRGMESRAALCNGPAKLTQALGIAAGQNGLDLCSPSSELWIEPGIAVSRRHIWVTPRIGLGQTPEPWLSKPWRYVVNGNGFVSGF